MKRMAVTMLFISSVVLAACTPSYSQNQPEAVNTIAVAEAPETTTTPAAEILETTTATPAIKILEETKNPPAAEASETTTTNTPVAEGEAKPKYAASIEAPEQVQSNEVFTITAALSNFSDNRATIRHASRLFEFIIKDSKGKRINTFAMSDVGIVRPFIANEPISEPFPYKFEAPGQYEVSAIAIFSVGEENYELETNKSVIKVIP